ncbi:YppF-like protein [Melghiribacillus thermohalophilus]|uniref:YppF-like protein n=1 Tax=Melghiribacillus thermohalophilus TaxID=1324956 RepID=A0A4R3N161_9BACI|nr:YppF family protein [Melghiribacillus thermohalophilus]TCT22444.1 YppF-like protein [Melghiribacillus thermohalophilus]
MNINELIQDYMNERNQYPESVNHLLDYCQQKYINGELPIHDYRILFKKLLDRGAVSAYQNA